MYDFTLFPGSLIGTNNVLEAGAAVVQTGNPSPNEPGLSFVGILGSGFSLSPGDSASEVLTYYRRHHHCGEKTETEATTVPTPGFLFASIPAGSTVMSDVSFDGMNFNSELV